jgi:hypothetical protein
MQGWQFMFHHEPEQRGQKYSGGDVDNSVLNATGGS